MGSDVLLYQIEHRAVYGLGVTCDFSATSGCWPEGEAASHICHSIEAQSGWRQPQRQTVRVVPMEASG